MICGGCVCSLHVKTAGLGGPALGSDEEEVIYIAYILLDVVSNKVIGEQQYAVRPTRKNSEELQTGQPLEVVIAQFEDYLRSLNVDPNSPLFRFVTDGQPPIRQCIQREACVKDITLPTYYGRFHDVRKEYLRAYTLRAVTTRPSPPPPDPPTCLGDMLSYLNLPAYDGEDVYAAEVKELNSIVQKIISDGYRLELPESVDHVLEPGIWMPFLWRHTFHLVLSDYVAMQEQPLAIYYRLPDTSSKDDEIDGNCIVRARGLPWQSSDQDIAKFFRGLNVAKGGVALCLSAQGRRNGEALVRFISQEHRDMALKRHKHHIGTRYIEVYKASGDDFLSVAGGASREAAAFLSRAAPVILRMRGLPYEATAQQVLDFFNTGEDPVEVVDGASGVLFVRKADGRATGDAFVLFAKDEDAPKALSRHRKSIGTRYIELFRSTPAEVQQVLNRSLEARPVASSAPSVAAAANAAAVANAAANANAALAAAAANAAAPQFAPLALPSLQPLPLPQHYITSGTAKNCIRLRGLPYEAQVEHILGFLDEFASNIMPRGVHMVYNQQGVPSGEAFIQMDCESSAYLCAQLKHHRHMNFGKKQRYIEVFQCSGDDMNVVLHGGAAALPPPHPHAAPHASPQLQPSPHTAPQPLSPGPIAFATEPFFYASPPYPLLLPPGCVWTYPTPPVSPARYYPTALIPEVLPASSGSPLPPQCPAECPVFMVN